MNVIIQNNVHASTNRYRTVCDLVLTKSFKPTDKDMNCPICKAKEKKRTEEIKAYIQKQLAEIEAGLPIDQGMWRVVGYVEGGLR